MIERMKELLRDEEGATMVEYALMLALIAVVCILVVQTLGQKAKGTFQQSADAMP